MASFAAEESGEEPVAGPSRQLPLCSWGEGTGGDAAPLPAQCSSQVGTMKRRDTVALYCDQLLRGCRVSGSRRRSALLRRWGCVKNRRSASLEGFT